MIENKMKIAILETGHFQYALTQSEIFADCELIIITTESMRKDMCEYAPEIKNLSFEIIRSIAEDKKQIIDMVNSGKPDVLFINPVFDSYAELKDIVKVLKCKKVLTTHNINTWFYSRFWSPNSLKDRLNLKAIIRNCDYIAVEDFIYNHLKSTHDILYRKYKFLYIPFTIFHEGKEIKFKRESERLKIVFTGAVDGERRRYEDVIELIESLKHRKDEVEFSFAGRPRGTYGQSIREKLREIQGENPGFVSFFEDDSTVEMFRKEMETSDLVISSSNLTFKGFGTVEYIGKTKPTAAIHDMISYQLPGLLPAHLKVPSNLEGSVFNYSNAAELKSVVVNLLDDQSVLAEWKAKAKQNSLHFTAQKIRKGLPF